MNLMQLLLVLRARFWIVLVVLIATVGIAYAVSLQLPKKYVASTSVLIDVRSPDPVSAVIDRAMVLPPNLTTQIDVIKSDRVARRVVSLLKLDQSPGITRQWLDETQGRGRLDVWLADLLKKKLSVSPSRDSMIINIDYEAVDPAFAAAVANGFAQAYVETNIELKVEPAKQYASWFMEQSKLLRENLEKAQTRLSAYQREKGLVARNDQVDAETVKLSDLTAQLTAVQAQTADALSKQRSGRAAEALPEVAQSPLVAGLKAQIATQEAKLEQVAGNLGKNHPQYRQMVSEIAVLRQQLDIATQHVMSGFATTRTVSRGKEAELRAAIEAQKKKLLELKSQRDELDVLQRDVDAANRAYNAVTARLDQATLESQATRTNVSILTPAVAPLGPSSPNLHKILLGALVAGMLLGAGLAFGVEVLDRRVRSADDVVAMLQLPVLGVIPRIKRPRQLAAPRHDPALALR